MESLSSSPVTSNPATLGRVCVFCGANPGRNPAFGEAAAEVGRRLAESGTALVYGGGRAGLMGTLADAALNAGGEVIGVIPQSLVDREIAHRGLSELRIVNTMLERKAMMLDLSSGFVALPGGFGTLDELFEVLTWAQIGLHAKPCGLLNVAGYFDGLLEFCDHAVEEGLLQAANRDLLITDTDPARLLERLAGDRPA